MEKSRVTALLTLKVEGGGHEGCRWLLELNKGQEMGFPLETENKCSPAENLIFCPVEYQTSNLQNREIKV